MDYPFKVCVCVRGSLALWPEMSHVADTAKTMCLNSCIWDWRIRT